MAGARGRAEAAGASKRRRAHPASVSRKAHFLLFLLLLASLGFAVLPAAPARAQAAGAAYYDPCEGNSLVDLGPLAPGADWAALIRYDPSTTTLSFTLGACEPFAEADLGRADFYLDTSPGSDFDPERDVRVEPSGGGLRWSVLARASGSWAVIASGAAFRPDDTSLEADVPASAVGATSFTFRLEVGDSQGVLDRLPEEAEPPASFPPPACPDTVALLPRTVSWNRGGRGGAEGVRGGEEAKRALESLAARGLSAEVVSAPLGLIKIRAPRERVLGLVKEGALPPGTRVERDRPARFFKTPSDPLYPRQWALPLVRAPEAWDAASGEGVVVAIIDSGVDGRHPDLAGRVLPGLDASTDQELPAGTNTDRLGHGTAVASVAAAGLDDGVGMAGLAGGARILPVRVGDPSGGACWSEVAKALVWAADHGAKVANLSLGGPDPSEAVKEAVSYARSRGVLVVASSGNEALEGNPPLYPAAFPEVLAVGATTRYDTRAEYSSYGPQLDLVAPGGAGLGTFDDDVAAAFPASRTRYAYYPMAGTSFAAPHVAGAAALALSLAPALGPPELEALLTLTSTDLGPAGRDDEYGWGRLDVGRAVKALLMTKRLAGPDRYSTSAAVSSALFPQASPVLLATGANFPDGLEAAPLSKALGAPVLLLPPPPSHLTPEVAAEVRRLGARRAVILGGPAAVGSGAEEDLAGMGIEVERVAGEDRYATASAVARRLGAPSGVVVIASGENFPDALSAGPLASLLGAPLLLSARDHLPAPTSLALSELGASRAVLVGGPAALSDEVEAELRARGLATERIYGPDRYATSKAVAERAEAAGASLKEVFAASGENFPDSLPAGAAASSRAEVLLLAPSRPSSPDLPSRSFLSSRRGGVGLIYLVGGPAALSEMTRVLLGSAAAS